MSDVASMIVVADAVDLMGVGKWKVKAVLGIVGGDVRRLFRQVRIADASLVMISGRPSRKKRSKRGSDVN